jgi:hypothetical protein
VIETNMWLELYNKFYMCSETVPVISLATWGINTRLFDGDDTADPVPALFVENARPSGQICSGPTRTFSGL